MNDFDQSSKHIDLRHQQVETQYIAGGNITLTGPPSKATVQERRIRKAMLDQVEHIWITGLLEQSLGDTILVTLRLREQPGAVANPWRSEVQELEQPARTLPPGTQMIEVYDHAKKALLILGESGSGKTTLLLELTRDLLILARQDDSDPHPFPVVFLLSSWAKKQQRLTEWLIEEMDTKYHVPRELGKVWIDTDQVLPLLDGLDEVAETHRAACIRAINDYRHEHGLVPLVVCSRSGEYLNQPMQLQLQSAVVVQPLIFQQIDDALSSAGEELGELRTALRRDPDMQELATSPFMLSILIKIARETQLSKVLSSGSLDARRQQIFATYVERTFKHGKKVTKYTNDQTLYWLAWLARQLLKFHQSAFYIERMQFDWLPAEQSRRLIMAVVFLFKLLIGVGTGLAGLLLFGLPGGLIFGLIGFYLAKPDLVNDEIEPAEKVSWSWASVKQHLVDSLFSGFKIGLFVVLLTLLLSIVSILLSFVLHKDMVIGYYSLSSLLTDGIIIMLGGELLFIIQSGWTSALLDERLLIKPNQGIWRSGRHGLIVGLIFFGVGGLTFSFLNNPVDGLLCGCILGLAVGLLNGGMACIKHALLRWSLWRAGVIPWHYSRFLDYGAERMFLYKVGGGYLFLHLLLLEYFATLYSPSLSRPKENHL